MIDKLYRWLVPSAIRVSIHQHRKFREVVNELKQVDNLVYAKQVLGVLNGRFPRECNICGFEGLFRAKSIPMRTDAHCPSCKSVGKHREIWMVIERHETIEKPCRLLHFAPEPCLTSRLKPLASEYTTADYMRRDVDLQINIEAIELESDSYDLIICNHVLEHVDHTKALPELFRILAPGGRAFLTAPVIWEWHDTYENTAVKTDKERELHFGQFDHLRLFGRDLVAAIQEAGFMTRQYTAYGEDCIKYSLLPGEKIFVAEKPGT
jgi:predicted Zn-ribbon and HTH transcriptional regulator